MRSDPRARIRPLALPQDGALLHAWFSAPRARFWGMQACSQAQVEACYRHALASGHVEVWLGAFDAAPPSFLFEAYDPAREEIGAHYAVQAGDRGMHCFVGPPVREPVPRFTRRVFRALLQHLFSVPGTRRIVVEPDLHNRKVHVLNREMGFVYQRVVRLSHKRAALAFLRREDFLALPPFPAPRKTTLP